MNLHPMPDARLRAPNAVELSELARDFVGQIATAVWLRKLTDAAAREVLESYAMACHSDAPAQARMGAALMREYRRRRERQDACS